MEIKFNINDKVKVKLTDFGRSEYKKILDERRKNAPHEYNDLFKMPIEKDGYSEWQLWILMANFGHLFFNGCEIPFEDNIIKLDIDN